MTVGHEIARRTGFRLFHNHQTIDLILRFFPFGSPAFNRLGGEFRTRIFEEVAGSELPGLIFTYVWDYKNPAELEYIERMAGIFRKRGGQVAIAELEASQTERLRRNETEFRLAEKPSKRDVAASRRNLLELDTGHQLNSKGIYDHRPDYFRLETTQLSVAQTADRIIQRFSLPLV